MELNVELNTQNIALFECLASDTRIRMLELLGERPMSIKEFADALGVSSTIVTKHVQKMEEAGLIRSDTAPGVRGTRKICTLAAEAVNIRIRKPAAKPGRERHLVAIPVGQYSAAAVEPTCGLATADGLIGIVDDPRYFADPEHVKAGLIWFGSGSVEYRIPNYMLGNQFLTSVEISLEMCSEAPGYNENWPSDISFYVNDVYLGYWTSPGDFGSSRGKHSPDWLNLGTQFGLLKTIIVTEAGTFIDGMPLSHVTLNDLSIRGGRELRFRVACQETADNVGGVTLFGKGFGNYNQDIEVSLFYEKLPRSKVLG